MLTTVTVQNSRSGTLTLPLLDSSAGYSVKDIQGLDPGKAALVSTQLAQMDGGQLHNARREPRNITMKLGLEPDYVSTTVAGLRLALYDYFMPKTGVTLGFYFDGVLLATTYAIVESNENNMFSADPEVNISLICYDPDLYAPAPTTFSGNTVNTTVTSAISYPGNSDTGIIFTITFPSTATAIRLYNTRPDNVTQIVDILGSFLAADQLIINTNPGSKAVTVMRSGLAIPGLSYLQPSQWIALAKGTNQFRAYYAPGGSLPYTVQYTAKYGGF